MKKWKKFWQRFRPLDRRHEAGFTLVELIVVIAIMAILGGVGTAGYSGYIKSANKGADKTLVGNVMRAIETGTYSTMFAPSNSMKISATTYPVGFVVLTTDGAKLLTSSTQTTEVAGACEFETVENIAVRTPHTYDSGCTQNKTGIYYSVVEGSAITYCKTHSPAPAIEQVGGMSYVTGYTHKKGNSITGCLFGCGGITAVNDGTYSDEAQIITNQESLYLQKNSTLCGYAYANQYSGFTGENSVAGADGDPDTSHALYQALEAAFGDLSSLKLSYDGWTSEGIDYATFYTFAPQLMDSVENLSGLLALAGSSEFVANQLGLSQTYNSDEEVLLAVGSNIVATYPNEESWLAIWQDACNQTWDSYGFGLTGRENYSAVRMGYNQAFASYLSALGYEQKWVETIQNFYSQESFGVGLPGLICTDAFTDSESPLKKKFEDADDTDGKMFAEIAQKFEEYKTSETCRENGRVLYNTMATFNATADIASDKNNAYSGDVFKYYDSYVGEIAKLYDTAQQQGQNGIIIIVTVEEGIVTCDVSPSSANPRND